MVVVGGCCEKANVLSTCVMRMPCSCEWSVVVHRILWFVLQFLCTWIILYVFSVVEHCGLEMLC